MELEQYFNKYLNKINRFRKQWERPKRLLVIRLGEVRLQAILMSREKGVYGIEECISKERNIEACDLRKQLQELLQPWGLHKGEVPLAIWQEEIYQEEFELPGLPMKQLKNLITEEAKLRIPLERESYVYNYLLFKGREEHIVRLSAIQLSMLEELKSLACNMGLSLEIVAGGLFKDETNEERIEFWNCFCDKEKAIQLQEEYGELIAFGIGCMQGEIVVNLLPKTAYWKNMAIFKPAIAIAGCLSLVLAGGVSSYFGWELNHIQQKAKETDLKLQELQPWKAKQHILLEMKQDIKQRETLYKQIKPKYGFPSFWLENIGQLIPAGCWLTSIEEKEEYLLLRGKALETGGVNLFRKQLQSIKICNGCELIECKQDTEGSRITFFLKVKR